VEKKKIVIIISIAFAIILIGVAYFVGTKQTATNKPEPPVSDTDKDTDMDNEESSTKPSKKDIVQGKKFVTMNTDSYI